MKKSITRNYLYNISYQLLVLIMPLITTPYISRILGAENIGMFGFTNSVTQYFVLFGCVGLNLYGQREIAYVQTNLSERSKVFWELMIIRVFSVSISFCLYALTVCRSTKYGMLFWAESAELLAAAFDVAWYFQGLEEFKKVVLRNLLIKSLGIIGIFMLVKTERDIYTYAIIYSASLLIGNLSLIFYLPPMLTRVSWMTLDFKKHLKPAFALFIPQIATNIYNLLDKTMIGMLTLKDDEVAFYEQAQKVMKIALAIPTSLGTVMLPRIASLYKNEKDEMINSYIYKSMRFVCMLSIPICFGLIAIAKDFVPWFFGEGYEKVIPNIRIIASIIIIVGFSNVMGVQYLLPIGKQKEYSISVILGTVTNFMFNMILIPRFLSYGAAIASIIAETVVTAIQVIYLHRILDFRNIIVNIRNYAFASMIMLLLLLGVSWLLNSNTAITTIIEIVFGVMCYMSVLALLKDGLFISLLAKLRANKS